MSKTKTKAVKKKPSAKEQWFNDLPEYKPDGLRGRWMKNQGSEIYYRDTMGINDYYDHITCIPTPPEKPVVCHITKRKCDARECQQLPNGKYVSHLGKVVTGGFVDAYMPDGSRATIMKTDAVVSSGSGLAYHRDCLGDKVKVCPKSNELVDVTEMVKFRGEEVSTSWLSSQRKQVVIQRHSYRPFFHPCNDAYACGIELEVEASDDLGYVGGAMLLKDEVPDNQMFLKRDGSLDNGFEMVTHPVSYEWIDLMIKPQLKKLSKIGVRSHQSGRCGLHVHIPRSSLSLMEVSKLVVFWNSNIDQFSVLSGRTPNRYCTADALKMDVLGGERARQHYAAINTENSATVEFRSFRGTLKPETFMGRIGLCFLVRSFIKQASMRDLSWDSFILWLCKHPHERRKFKPSWRMIANMMESHPNKTKPELIALVERIESKKR